MKTIVYGAVTDHTASLTRFALTKGFFQDAGIDLILKTVYGGPEMAAAVERNDVQIGEVGTPPGLTAIGAGSRIRIVGSALDRGLAFFLIAHPSIKSWADFKGKTVAALSRGSCGYWYLRDLLAQHDVDPDKDVSFRYLGAESRYPLKLFASGEVSGMLASEPWVTLGEREGVARFWGGPLELGDVPDIQWSIQIANLDTIDRDPELIRKTLRVVRDTAQYAKRHREEWIAFYADLNEVDVDVARLSIEREWPLFHFDGQVDVPGLERAIDYQYRIKSIPRRLTLTDVTRLELQPEPVEVLAFAK